MRLVYPFVESFPAAVASLPYFAERVDVSSDDEAYYRLLARLWHEQEDFVILEQDHVLPPEALEGFKACSYWWCGHPYWLYGGWGVWHGLVRYRWELMALHPDLPESIVTRNWKALDSAWINHLRLLGHSEAHWHWPAVEHLRPKHLPGMGVTRFINCAGCGAALDGERLQTSPHVVCDRCGLGYDWPMPKQTATDNVF